MNAPSDHGFPWQRPAFRRERRPARADCPPELLMTLLWAIYRRDAARHCRSVRALHRQCGAPYETLRAFLAGESFGLCGVNEEKLARALGHDSAFYRRLARRFHRFRSRH